MEFFYFFFPSFAYSVNGSGSVYIQIYCLVWFFPHTCPPECRGFTRSYYDVQPVLYPIVSLKKRNCNYQRFLFVFPFPHLFFDQVVRSSSSEFTFVAFLMVVNLVILYKMILCFAVIVLFIPEREGQSMSLKN